MVLLCRIGGNLGYHHKIVAIRAIGVDTFLVIVRNIYMLHLAIGNERKYYIFECLHIIITNVRRYYYKPRIIDNADYEKLVCDSGCRKDSSIALVRNHITESNPINRVCVAILIAP